MRTAVITGATGGIGLATAQALAQAGCRVVLTGRDQSRGDQALGQLRRAHPEATAEFRLLDMASQRSIAAFAAGWIEDLAILVNNAGVMGYDPRRTTEDGFEAQFGTNHLGHFALTLRLLPALLRTEGARVVTVSSLAHRRARIDLADLQGERTYRPMTAYAQSKLANLLFALELDRRARAAGWPLASIAAHPGWTATRIVTNGFGTGLKGRIAQLGFDLLAQSATWGALPLVYAALDSRAQSGGYYGPRSLGETRGEVGPSITSTTARDPAIASELWTVSERLTGLTLAEIVSQR